MKHKEIKRRSEAEGDPLKQIQRSRRRYREAGGDTKKQKEILGNREVPLGEGMESLVKMK